ncbi:adenylate/guanylate cyclase domain-containing protein [Pseudomonas mosselii]|uniref:adenylate/guanylate cyclase domain-containing protein n=1 Tax=Pseudomonas mosselii TaxID=78327 RepID=UPI001F406D95|nr:adenylate/guanylate cyclase domain-containing protein [Pseudomonas mosselii]
MSAASKRAFEEILNKSKRKKSVAKSVTGMDSFFESHPAFESIGMDEAQSEEDHALQRQYRPLFGKEGINENPIGCHPDFRKLQGTSDTEYHFICSLFIDIKNSTRLSFLYPLEDVVSIKNSILKAAAEIVRCLDGYVHRFMGDAVLAYFGGLNHSKDDSIINAINCASLLESLMTGTIIPVLETQGYKGSDLGFRIGLDYGPTEEVLWASYGSAQVNEVTATSFYVDVASKLQSMARKNQAMLGESIISDIDFPSEYLNKKTVINNGVREEVEHLNKVYTNRQGLAFRYKVREMNHAAYRDLLPFSATEKAGFNSSSAIGNDKIDFRCFTVTNGTRHPYASVSKVLSKKQKLKFKLTILKSLADYEEYPLVVQFTKRNYGKEAALGSQAGVFPRDIERVTLPASNVTSVFEPAQIIEFDETTEFRGLHTMEAEVKNSTGEVIYRHKIGIYIE